ncbi:hypothetical protein ACGFX8_28705 [Streptomyces sp. NPDC048362]|uniref:hypothetical protein n=1 Tax=Streptomyces sp. NPDC048362 TaxID=3365539 RepID=UPI00371A8584
MNRKPWNEYTPAERDDVNRLGYLYESFVHHLTRNTERDAFTAVMAGAFGAEYALSDADAYPPAGHGYPRLEA